MGVSKISKDRKRYLFCVGDKFITGAKSLRYKLTSDINKASIWDCKSKINTWNDIVLRKYPNAKIKEAYTSITLI